MDPKKMNGNAPKQEKKEFPKYESPLQKSRPNFFSRFLFCWMFPIYYSGTKRDLEEFDLVPAKQQYDSKPSGDILERLVVSIVSIVFFSSR